jgi:hypothetical protein
MVERITHGADGGLRAGGWRIGEMGGAVADGSSPVNENVRFSQTDPIDGSTLSELAAVARNPAATCLQTSARSEATPPHPNRLPQRGWGRRSGGFQHCADSALSPKLAWGRGLGEGATSRSASRRDAAEVYKLREQHLLRRPGQQSTRARVDQSRSATLLGNRRTTLTENLIRAAQSDTQTYRQNHAANQFPPRSDKYHSCAFTTIPNRAR